MAKQFITDTEKRILLSAISREMRVVKENNMTDLIPVVRQLDYYFMYDRLFKQIYRQCVESFAKFLIDKGIDGFEMPDLVQEFLEKGE